MSYLSENEWFIRVWVRNFDTKECDWEFARAERVAYAIPDAKVYKAYQYKYGRTIKIHVMICEWDTIEYQPIFTISKKSLSLALDKLHLVVYELE